MPPLSAATIDPLASLAVTRGAGQGAPHDDEAFRLLVDSVTDYAIFMLDPEGLVQTWNAGAQRIKGYAADEIIGRSFELFYPPELVERGWPREELKIAALQGRLEDQGWRVRKDGSRFWADIVITALRGADGTLRGFGKVTRDSTQRRRQEESLRQSEEQFRLLVESVQDYAIFMLDPKGRVLTWNAGAAAIKGYAADEVLLRDFSMFFTAEDVAAGKPEQELAMALEKGRARSEGHRVRKDGSLFWADVVLTPVLDRDGVLRGFAKVTRDLSAQRRLAELERASQRMNEFIAMLAHELRNPLAPIRNAVSVVQMQEGLPPAVMHMNEIVDRQAAHLTRLVDDLLDVGRVVSGKISLKRQQIDYRDIVQASVDAVRPQAEARRHRLALNLPDPVQMWGDPTRLTQALQNLLHNAIRYTPDGGEIRVALRLEGARSVTTVTDTGQGIAPEALERIFELFVQEDAAHRTPSESGLGIGLSLARTMAELHGGRLSAFSEGPGRGSTFTLVLPTRKPVPAGTGTAGQATLGAMSRRVLVVDDNRDSADSMVALLQTLGHAARSAYDADAALEIVPQWQPQIVLLDLNMPGVDGFEAIERLRAQSAEPLYVAAMTGYGQKGASESTLVAGFQSHLTKPVGVEQLMNVLREAE